MRILFIVPYVPSLIRTRSYNILNQLAARGHQVTLFTIRTGGEDNNDIHRLSHLGVKVQAFDLASFKSLWNCIRVLPTRYPLQSAYSWNHDLAKAAIASRHEFDVIHVEHLRGARYGISLLDIPRHDRPPVIWDSVDCITHLFTQAAKKNSSISGRAIARLELPRTRWFEAYLASQFEQVLITSEKDRETLLRLVSVSSGQGVVRGSAYSFSGVKNDGDVPRIEILPNGVDIEYFAPDGGERDAASIVLSGKMSYHANVAAAKYLVEEIMPIVWSKIPSARLVIAGKDPPRAIRGYANSHPGKIEVTGTVPDIRTYLRKASAAAVPILYGAGSQFKVLEAMGCGTPVVATSLAVSSFNLRPGKDVLVADKAEEFATALIEILSNRGRQRDLSVNGRRTIEREFGWDGIVERLVSIYDKHISSSNHG
jgi:glycosyltransferase involved in cell wall biosynthesis